MAIRFVVKPSFDPGIRRLYVNQVKRDKVFEKALKFVVNLFNGFYGINKN